MSSFLRGALPALRNSTVTHPAVGKVVAGKVVREIIPQLKPLGAEGIIKYPRKKVVHWAARAARRYWPLPGTSPLNDPRWFQPEC